jgi:hypothetical protein
MVALHARALENVCELESPIRVLECSGVLKFYYSIHEWLKVRVIGDSTANVRDQKESRGRAPCEGA